MERETLNIRINDRFLMGEIDNTLHSSEIKHKHHVTDAKKTILYIEILFTAHLIKNFKSKEHYIKSFVSGKKLPEVEAIIRKQQTEFATIYSELKKQVATIPNYKEVYNHLYKENQHIKVPVLISPVVMLFISLISLTDNIIKQYRVLYLCGLLSKKDFYKNRKTVLKKFSNVRLNINNNRTEYNELVNKLLEKKGM